MNIDDLKNLIKNGQFINPTKGAMNLQEVVAEITDYRNEDLEFEYKLVVGSDSQERGEGVDFVSVIAIHRVGRGGRYFWLRSYDEHKLELRSRIYKEATLSLALALALLEQELYNNHIPVAAGKSIIEAIKELKAGINNDIFTNNLEIHVDIGENGPTKAMIKEIVGMIRGSGFYVKIKPESFAASSLADKHL